MNKKILFSFLILVGVLVLGVSQANAQFVVGARVEVVTGASNLNVRPVPSTSSPAIGLVNSGDLGNVIGGPVSAQGYSWSQVAWDKGISGWSVNTPWLRVVAPSTSTSTLSCGDVNKDGAPDVVDVNLVINVAFRGQTYPNYNTDVNGSGVTDVVDVTQIIDYVFRGGLEPSGCRLGPVGSLSLSVAPLGVSTNRMKSNSDDLARLDFRVTGGDVVLNSLRVTFANGALSGNNNFGSGVYIFSPNWGTIYSGTSSPSCSSSLCYVDFNFGKEISGGFVIPAGGVLPLVVRVDSTRLGQASGSQNLVAFVDEYYDIKYTDSQSGISNLTLPLSNFPITLNNVFYGQSSNLAPVITSFTGPSALDLGVGGTWSFSLSDPEGYPVNYSINFGDTVTSTTGVATTSAAIIRPGHAYSQPGNYNVTLTGMDQGGLTVSRVLPVMVYASSSNQEPSTPVFTGPNSTLVNQAGTWYARSDDPNGDNLTYYFDFDQTRVDWGTSSTYTRTGASGATVSVNHTYRNPGVYKAVVSVNDNRPGISSWSSSSYMWVSVTSTPTSTPNQPPYNLSISGPPTNVTSSMMTYWAFRAYDTGSSLLTYSVNWGDGTTNATSAPSGYYWNLVAHQYDSNGTYTVTFTAIDSGGLSASVSRSVTVNVGAANQPPVINSFTGPTALSTGVSYAFSGQATDPNGDQITYQFGWGDGTPSSTTTGASGAIVSVNKAYASPGTYGQRLQARDSYGAGWQEMYRTVTVTSTSTPTSTTNQPPTSLYIDVTPTSTAPIVIGTFKAVDPEGGNLTYQIVWGDGASDTAISASGGYIYRSHTYPANGTYSVAFTATDQAGLSTTITKVVTVGGSPIAPTAPLLKTSPYFVPSASVIDSMQAQLFQISAQLLLLLQQIR